DVGRNPEIHTPRDVHGSERHHVVGRENGVRRIWKLEEGAHGRLTAAEPEIAVDNEKAVELEAALLKSTPVAVVLMQPSVTPAAGPRQRPRNHPDTGESLPDEVHRRIERPFL